MTENSVIDSCNFSFLFLLMFYLENVISLQLYFLIICVFRTKNIHRLLLYYNVITLKWTPCKIMFRTLFKCTHTTYIFLENFTSNENICYYVANHIFIISLQRLMYIKILWWILLNLFLRFVARISWHCHGQY